MRAMAQGLLGLGAAVQSLQITRAELSGPSPENSELKLQGTVTVPEVFSVAEGSVTVQVGQKIFAFVLDASGGATRTGNSFQVRNADRSGVVRGGLMEFESTLSGRELKQELQIAGAPQTAAGAPPRLVPIAMSVDSVAHSANVQIKSFQKER